MILLHFSFLEVYSCVGVCVRVICTEWQNKEGCLVRTEPGNTAYMVCIGDTVLMSRITNEKEARNVAFIKRSIRACDTDFQLMVTSFIRMPKSVAGARRDGCSISETADLLGFARRRR